MSGILIVHKGRTNVVGVSMGISLVGSVCTSEIRAEPDQESTLIATWNVAVVGDGTSGELTLTMDDVITAQIQATSGYMDIKRVVGGEPMPVFDKPLEVVFQGTVTV